MGILREGLEKAHLQAFRESQVLSTAGETIRAFYEAQQISPAPNRMPMEKEPTISHLYEIDVSSIEDGRVRASIVRMQQALQNIILWNQEHAAHECGDPDKAENLACIKECRDSLKTVQGLLKPKQQSN